MLILTRRPGEKLFVGDDIEVEVLGLAGKQVRLGITAPDDVVILREEVRDRQERETVQVGSMSVDISEGC